MNVYVNRILLNSNNHAIKSAKIIIIMKMDVNNAQNLAFNVKVKPTVKVVLTHYISKKILV